MWPVRSHFQRMQSFISAAGKRQRATATGPAVTPPSHQVSRRWCHCHQEESVNTPLQKCSGCSSATCCSTACQRQHWQQHKHICRTVRLVEKHLGQREQNDWFSHKGISDLLSDKQGKKIMKLIGRRKIVKCTFDSIPVTALWDTGAQATVINKKWRAEHLPHTTIRGVEELLA